VAAAFVFTFEAGARELDWHDPAERPDPYLGFAGTGPLFHLERQQNGLELYVTSPNKRAKYRLNGFAKEKAKGGIRVFCLGGSSVKSDSLPPEGTFPGLLKIGIEAMRPGVAVEVVNAGGGGTGTFQYREVEREVRRLGADLIVVYPEAGERNYMPPLPEGEMAERDANNPLRADARRALAQSRLYAAVRDAMESLRPAAAQAAKSSAFALAAIDVASREYSPSAFSRIFDFKKDRIPPIMPPMVPRERIEAAHARFVENLVTLAGEAREAGVPVLLVDTVRNLKADFYLRCHVEPGELRPGSDGEWRRHYAAALERRRAKKWDEALAEFAAARNCYVEDRDEILGFYMGQCHEAMGRFEEARAEYERAFLKHPLKIKIREAAAAAKAPLADPYPELVAASPRGIPDSSMFTDAFHPQARTNAAIARAILGAIVGNRMIPGLEAGGEALARGREAIDAVAGRTEVFADKQLQLAVYAEDYRRAVEIARRRPLKDLHWLELMYLGYAEGKLGMGADMRQTYLVLREQMVGEMPGRARRLDNDADVVRYVFDGDLFSDF
jgi:hypothetical protein